MISDEDWNNAIDAVIRLTEQKEFIELPTWEKEQIKKLKKDILRGEKSYANRMIDW